MATLKPTQQASGLTDANISTSAAITPAKIASNIPYVSGLYYPSEFFYVTGTAAVLSDSYVSYVPYIVRDVCAAIRIAVQATVGVNTKKVRLGIYNQSGTLPTTLLVDGGEVACSGTGAQTLEVTISQALNPGLYFVAIITNDTGITTNYYGVTYYGGLGIDAPGTAARPYAHVRENAAFGALAAVAGVVNPLVRSVNAPPMVLLKLTV